MHSEQHYTAIKDNYLYKMIDNVQDTGFFYKAWLGIGYII
jgi:hypothetical protein